VNIVNIVELRVYELLSLCPERPESIENTIVVSDKRFSRYVCSK